MINSNTIKIILISFAVSFVISSLIAYNIGRTDGQDFCNDLQKQLNTDFQKGYKEGNEYTIGVMTSFYNDTLGVNATETMQREFDDYSIRKELNNGET